MVAGLIEAGVVRSDGHRMGLEVTDALGPVDRDGCAAPGIWALGPIVRGVFWDCTAVPDIRFQAQAIADGLVRQLVPSELAPARMAPRMAQ